MSFQKDILSKQEQLQQNKILLSSLNNNFNDKNSPFNLKPNTNSITGNPLNTPIFQTVHPGYPLFQMTPSGQLIPVQTFYLPTRVCVIKGDENIHNQCQTSMSFNSSIEQNNYFEGEPFKHDVFQLKSNNKSSTSLSFCRTSNESNNEFMLQKKTKRNKIIINDVEEYHSESNNFSK